MLFLDGVGIGKRDPFVNPLIAADLPSLSSLTGNFSVDAEPEWHGPFTLNLRLDANLGVKGLPQSGTGQTALFTGVNAAKELGRHFGPYPHSSLRPILQEKNLFKKLRASGKRVRFANAFPQRFFDHIATRPSRITVTTLSCLMSDVPLMRAEDLREMHGISANITNVGWHDLGYPDIPVIAPQEAGRRLARMAEEHDFVLFEYWKTDHAGHSMDMKEAIEVLTCLDNLLEGLLKAIDSERVLLVITSDHGNIEDMSVKGHTRNPVPLILHGAAHESVAREITSNGVPDLTNVAPALLRCLTSGE